MKKVSKTSVILLILAGLCIAASIYLPIWRIELDAPQYPEGLALQIYADKLSGDVDIINGLNHYIGMRTLHTEDFWEFAILPYILGFFVLWTFVTALIRKRSAILILLIGFLLFGILAMYDFWNWEYAYGHELDPTAAIQVPGMSYQPPLIGFKQLLNFGAYSIPDTGGWLMLSGGLLIAFVFFYETGWLRFGKFSKKTLFFGLLVLFVSSCKPHGPEPITLHKDGCEHCKMKISEGHFAAEAITLKGRVLKFDDLYCLIEYKKSNPNVGISSHFVHYYPGDNELMPAETSFFIRSNQFKSPMGGNIASFKTEAEVNEYLTKYEGEKLQWNDLFQE